MYLWPPNPRRTPHQRLCALALAFALGHVPAPAHAGVLEGIRLADTVKSHAGPLLLNGMVLYEATFLKVDVFVGGLYLQQKTHRPKDVLDTAKAKRMVQVYVRDIGAKDMRKGFKKALLKAAGDRASSQRANIERFVKFFSDIEENDRLSYDFAPGRGLEVHQRGRRVGLIKDPKFASLLFSLWIGPTADPSVRDPLLGRPSK